MANQCKECTVEKYIQCVTMLSLTIQVYLHSFSCCWLPNLRISVKIWENSNWKAVQGHPRCRDAQNG